MTEGIVHLTSQEGTTFIVPLDVAKMSNLVKTMLDPELPEDEEQKCYLPNVKSVILSKVVEFLTHYKEEPMTEIEKPLRSSNMNEVVQKWYAEFANVDQEILFEIIQAANFMDIPTLLDLTCATIASMVKGKTPEEIREHFKIVNDFTEEEEAQIREENKWCEEI